MKYQPVEAVGKQLETPEGVPIHMTIAPAGDRVVGFAIDVFLIVLGLFSVGLLAIFLSASAWGVAMLLLLAYGLMMFSWIWFEIRWQGQTPGKRKAGIRVVDRFGGPLRADAIFVRNITRQVETVIPFAALSNPEALFPNAPPSIYALLVAWVVILAFVPLFNKDRMRLGDLLAGTVVVTVPEARLLDDLGKAVVEGTAEKAAAPRYTFTKQQLSIYGIYELQVLEDLLRQPRPERNAMRTVFRKVTAKIDWEGPRNVDPREFLEEFYAAQRAALEHEMLFGERRERKQ